VTVLFLSISGFQKLSFTDTACNEGVSSQPDCSFTGPVVLRPHDAVMNVRAQTSNAGSIAAGVILNSDFISLLPLS
jgi:hypothetical protein